MEDSRQILHESQVIVITANELEITKMVAAGMTYRGISVETGYSKATIKRRVKGICNKLGVDRMVCVIFILTSMGLLGKGIDKCQ